MFNPVFWLNKMIFVMKLILNIFLAYSFLRSYTLQIMFVILGKVLFMIFSIAIAAADIKTGMVHRLIFILAFPLFIVLAQLQGVLMTTALTGALLGLSIFLLAYFVSGKKLGLADVWYSAIIGLVLGPWWWYTAMAFACVAGVVYIAASKKRKIPFIPLMAMSSTVINIIRAFF